MPTIVLDIENQPREALTDYISYVEAKVEEKIVPMKFEEWAQLVIRCCTNFYKNKT